MNNRTSITFLILSLTALILGVFFGLFASLQYLIPDFFKNYLPFTKMRPFHVTTVISWIILCSTGSIYFFINKIEDIKLFSYKLQKIHLLIFLLTGIGIYISFFSGEMEGREYLAFTPFLTIPILIGWVIFGLNFYKTIRNKVKNWPVYYWMWGTGIVFMIYHLCEAHFWLIPSFRENFIKDISIQWKSYGSFVGSWNMLVYGIAIYVMSKIKNDITLAFGKKTFFFYFLGLINLMFGWAHHTYIIPIQPWIRYLSYGISMSEWILLINIIYNWKKNLPKINKEKFSISYKFLISADYWVFLNLILALLFSIPAINFFTHGTHITVAHSMGTTIGINTSILLGSLFYIVSKLNLKQKFNYLLINRTIILFNVALLLFWLSLLYAGSKRSNWMYFNNDISFSQMQDSIYYAYLFFFIFGILLATSILIISSILLKFLFSSINFNKKTE